MSVPTVSWDENSPAGNTNINLGDNRIRELKTQIREVIDVDHQFNSSGQDADNGKHTKCSFLEQADLGTGATGKPIFGAQTVSGVAEMVWTTEGDTDLQFTSGNAFHPDILNFDGMIVMWSGTLASIPTGWQICDGTNSTPNLLGKMIPCVASSTDPGSVSGDSYVGAHTHTGPSHTHTIDSHNHALTVKDTGDPRLQTTSDGPGGSNTTYIAASGELTSNAGGTGNTGSTGSATFYALAYIYKT